MKSFSSTLRRVLLAVLVLIGALAMLWPSNRAPVTVLRQPVRMPVPLRNRLAPATRRWFWAWRLENALFGQRKPVNLNADLVSLGDSSIAALSSPALGEPSYSDTNGLQIWLLRRDQLTVLRGDLKRAYAMDVVRACRVSTADAMEAQLFNGTSFRQGGFTNEVGLAFRCFPQVHSGSTDLITCITFSELVTNQPVRPAGWEAAARMAVQTNLDAALRLQLPKGKGFFLLDRALSEPGRRRFGLIVELL